MLKRLTQCFQIKIDKNKGKSIYLNDTMFDSLASIFDYYAYLFIAYELDSYELFLGDTYYSKAHEIASMGISSNYSSGWDTKLNEIRSSIRSG